MRRKIAELELIANRPIELFAGEKFGIGFRSWERDSRGRQELRDVRSAYFIG